MPKHVKGNFNGLSKAERAVAMQVHLRRLEQNIFNVEFSKRHSVNEEIEDLLVKLTRAKSSPVFETKEFFDLQRKYQNDDEYRQKIDDVIFPPAKEEKGE